MEDKRTLGMARELLAHLQTYLLTDAGESWPRDFGTYLASLPDPSEDHTSTEPEESDAAGLSTALGATLVALANVIRRQASRALRESPFATIMDYQFLFVLRSHGPMSKSALIDANGMETSSGTEVIKRIHKAGWIAEEPNPADGRSILVHITEQGEGVEAGNRDSVSTFYASLSGQLDQQHQRFLMELVHAITAAE